MSHGTKNLVVSYVLLVHGHSHPPNSEFEVRQVANTQVKVGLVASKGIGCLKLFHSERLYIHLYSAVDLHNPMYSLYNIVSNAQK